jgi:hypothetical protein
MKKSKLLLELEELAFVTANIKSAQRMIEVEKNPEEYGLYTNYFNPIELFMITQTVKLKLFIEKNLDLQLFLEYIRIFGDEESFTASDVEYLKTKRQTIINSMIMVLDKIMPERIKNIQDLLYPNPFEAQLSWIWCLMVNFIKKNHSWVDYLEFCNEINIDLETMRSGNLTQYFLRHHVFYDIDPILNTETE